MFDWNPNTRLFECSTNVRRTNVRRVSLSRKSVTGRLLTCRYGCSLVRSDSASFFFLLTPCLRLLHASSPLLFVDRIFVFLRCPPRQYLPLSRTVAPRTCRPLCWNWCGGQRRDKDSIDEEQRRRGVKKKKTRSRRKKNEAESDLTREHP